MAVTMGPQKLSLVDGVRQVSSEELAAQLAAIVDSSEDAIIGRGADGVINTWNAAATRIFGYTAEEMLGQSMLLLVPPELHGEELANLERLRRGETVGQYHTQCFRKGGERLDVSVSLSPIRDSQGRLLGSALILRDVGDLRKEHAAKARLTAIMESSDDGIVAKDLNGVITDWNVGAERIFGYSKEEIIGRSILTIIPPELQHEEPVLLGKIRAGERVEHFQTYRLHKSGRRVDVSLTLSPILDASGRVIGASKLVRDVTEGRRSERDRLMLAAIVESSDDAIISKSLDGIITSWNAAAERMFGYKVHEIVGHSVLRLIPPELHFEEPRILSRLRAGERIEHYETRRLRKNGEVFYASLTVSPVRDSQGRVVGASKIVRDISDRKAAEAALLQREKFAVAGRLAATLAHEVNNPLESITNLAYLLSRHPSLDDEARGYANLLLQEVQRAGEITRQTLSYYRESRSTTDVSVIETIEHTLRWKSKKLESKRVTVEKQFETDRWVKGYAGELRQVFENLIENAIEAVGHGGHIRVRARLQGTRGSERECMIISVCDDGPGIPPRVKPRIFDPFFTTKLQTGNGLGLWVTREVIRRHGGTIRVRSSEDRGRHGSVFTIQLPVSATAPRQKTNVTAYAG